MVITKEIVNVRVVLTKYIEKCDEFCKIEQALKPLLKEDDAALAGHIGFLFDSFGATIPNRIKELERLAYNVYANVQVARQPL